MEVEALRRTYGEDDPMVGLLSKMNEDLQQTQNIMRTNLEQQTLRDNAQAMEYANERNVGFARDAITRHPVLGEMSDLSPNQMAASVIMEAQQIAMQKISGLRPNHPDVAYYQYDPAGIRSLIDEAAEKMETRIKSYADKVYETRFKTMQQGIQAGEAAKIPRGGPAALPSNNKRTTPVPTDRRSIEKEFEEQMKKDGMWRT
jgi:hypothetical protein